MSNKPKPSIEQLIKEMPKQKQPSRDLWAGIEHQINSQVLGKQNSHKQRSRNNFYAIAASIALITLVGYFGVTSVTHVNNQSIVAEISKQHMQQKQRLLTSFAGQVAKSDNWQQQLDELDKAAEAIRKALENEPNNTALLQMLKQVHQQQIALIERVHSPKWQQI